MTLVVLGGLVFGGGGWTWGLLVAAVLAGRFGLALRGRISEDAPKLVDRDDHLGVAYPGRHYLWS